MEAKIPSGPSPGLTQQKPKSDHPLGRVLEPLGFYRHPILFALGALVSFYLFAFVCRQYCDADSCQYYRRSMMSAFGFFFFIYGIWAQGVKKLAVESRQREECALRNEKTPLSAY
ncbi:hypothetical protein ACN38_g7841 [Penicillium nordicum]|uniref:Uncharacterized protein n=1 Tax=Penicillium nordicum TaxID=229535 RepID=A0A0M8NXE6_9EURO|nr:hypothetical protein ACN38_g7841 [Penicillium nordicum]